MAKTKKKKPSSKVELVKAVVEIIAAIANIAFIIYQMLKG